MHKWISVKDSLPEFTKDEEGWYCSDWILVWTGTNRFLALYEKYPNKDAEFIRIAPKNLELPFAIELKNVTHWMPLPELPKE